MGLEFFGNERFNILRLLFDNQILIKGEKYINLSQQEIADIAHYSKFKANKLINELIDMGYVFLYKNKRGKYALSDKALKVIEVF